MLTGLRFLTTLTSAQMQGTLDPSVMLSLAPVPGTQVPQIYVLNTKSKEAFFCF